MVEKLTDDKDVAKISDWKNRKSTKGCFSRSCKKKYVLEEEFGINKINEEEEFGINKINEEEEFRINKINEEEERHQYSDSKSSPADFEENDYNKN